MEPAFSFMPIYLQTASFFVNGEIFNQTQLMSFSQFASVANFHAGTFRARNRLLAKSEFPALKVALILKSPEF